MVTSKKKTMTYTDIWRLQIQNKMNKSLMMGILSSLTDLSSKRGRTILRQQRKRACERVY